VSGASGPGASSYVFPLDLLCCNDDPSLNKRLNFLIGQPELAQARACVFAEQRAASHDAPGCLGHLDGHSGDLDGRAARLLHIDDHLARRKVRVCDDLRDIHDRTERNLAGQALDELCFGEARRLGIQLGDQAMAIARPTDAGIEVRVGEQVRRVDAGRQDLKEFVLMGGGLYADKGAIDPGALDARREFNWWFDPEATRIVLHAPWKKVTITPIDISVKTRYTTEMKATITKAGTPVTQYLEKYSLPGYMWDEIAGAALIDPSIITAQKKLYMDIDVDHGASYGKTIFWNSTAKVPPYLRLASVQFDIDAEKFYKIYIDLMTRPARK